MDVVQYIDPFFPSFFKVLSVCFFQPNMIQALQMMKAWTLWYIVCSKLTTERTRSLDFVSSDIILLYMPNRQVKKLLLSYAWVVKCPCKTESQVGGLLVVL